MGPPPGASPPMRMIASWSGSNDPTRYKGVAGRWRQWRAPLGSTDRQVPFRRRSYAKSPCRGSSSLRVLRHQALRNTSDASRQAAKLCYRFGPLTPSARSANLIARRRGEERPSRPEQRTGNKPKRLLDRKGPIQVRISPPPARSQQRTVREIPGSARKDFFHVSVWIIPLFQIPGERDLAFRLDEDFLLLSRIVGPTTSW